MTMAGKRGKASRRVPLQDLAQSCGVLEMPMREIGTAAIDLLRDLRGGLAQPARRIELACRLRLRTSGGPVAGH